MSTGTGTHSPDRVRHPAAWCGGGTNGGIFCGLMLLVVGAIWIGKKTGVIPLDMALFWPSVMVIAGVWILVSAVMRKSRQL